MSTETVAVAGLVFAVVALSITVVLAGFNLAHRLGSIGKELAINTTNLKDMATKRDLDDQTAILRAELSGQTDVIKADLSGLEKRTLDGLASIRDDLKDLKAALPVRLEKSAGK